MSFDLGGLGQLLGRRVSETLMTPLNQERDRAAQRYEAAFNKGDLNSPDVIGVDPKYFGYAEDSGVRPQEDDVRVLSPKGIRPLWDMNPGEQWQNPQTGFSPNGYNPGIGNVLGQGASSRFPSFEEILRRR